MILEVFSGDDFYFASSDEVSRGKDGARAVPPESGVELAPRIQKMFFLCCV